MNRIAAWARIALVAGLLPLAGCAGIAGSGVTFQPVAGVKYSSLKAPAQRTSQSAERLYGEGYAKVGRLTVQATVRRCTKDSKGKQCKDLPQKQGPTERLLAEAAARGAERVAVQEDNTEDTASGEGLGNCLEWNHKTSVQEGAFYNTYTTTATCARYETVNVTDTVRTSSGVLWHHDPATAHDQQRRDQLVAAAGRGDAAAVRRMLDAGLPADARDTNGVTALWAAIQGRKPVVLALLTERLTKQAAPKSLGEVLHAAAAQDDPKLIQTLIKRGANVNAKDANGTTPLAVAAMLGKAKATRALIAAGADVNARSRNLDGATPLLLAAASDNVDVVKQLLVAKADPWATNDEKWLAVDVAQHLLGNDSQTYHFLSGYTHGAYGFIDKSGRFVIKPWYDDVGDFSEGLVSVGLGGTYSWDMKWGFVDKQGKVRIPLTYDKVGMFSEGVAVVETGGHFFGKYGYVDKTGKVVIPLKLDDAHDFSEGLAAVEKDHKWGFIDHHGRFVIEPRFDDVHDFSEGLAAAKDAAAGKWGYVDKQGHWAVAARYERADPFSDGLAAVMTGPFHFPDTDWGYVDRNGKGVLMNQLQFACDFHEGRACVMQDGDWGYIDASGHLVVKPQYKSVGRFSEGLARVAGILELSGYIDKNGKTVIGMQYNGAHPFSEGLALVRDEHLVGVTYKYINKTGKPAIKQGFLSTKGWDELLHAGYTQDFKSQKFNAGNFSEGLAPVKVAEGVFLSQYVPDAH